MTDQPQQADRFDLVGMKLLWPQVLQAVRDVSPATATLLDNATLTAVTGDKVRLSLPTPSLARRLNDDSNRTVIEWALKNNTVGLDWTVETCLTDDLRLEPSLGSGLNDLPILRCGDTVARERDGTTVLGIVTDVDGACVSVIFEDGRPDDFGVNAHPLRMLTLVRRAWTDSTILGLVQAIRPVIRSTRTD